MSGTDDFDREVKALVNRGKLSSSAVASLSELAMANIRSDSQLVSSLYRHHRKASPANKLVSLYLIDAIAREARSRQKTADKEGKGAGTAAGSTTPAESPPGAAAGPSAGEGDFASFLRKLEAVLSKIVLDNWENGLPEHREKVRKVLDIWTRASTFGASALAKISTKLLAVSAAAPAAVAAPLMSPGRPSLSPGPAADTPPRDSTTTATAPAPAVPAGIPANVLALLQAKAPPSQAALEQKKHDDVESEVERALREAREGTSLATSDAPRVSGPGSFAPSHTPYAGNVPSTSAPFGHSRTSHGGSNPYSAPSGGAPHPQPGPPASPYEAQRPGPSSRSVGGGYGSAPASGSGGGGAYGSSSNASYQSPQGQYGLHNRNARAGSQDFANHSRQQSGGQRDGGRGADARDGSDPRTSYQSRDSYGGGGPRGQTRSFDASQTGPGDNAYGDPASTYGRPEEPPAKRPYQPDAASQNAPSHGGGYGQPALASSFAGESTPHQQQGFDAPSASGSQSNAGSAPSSSSTGTHLDPITFDATSPASWSTFVNLLRTSHPYFASLGRMPTMEEVMGLCAPSAMMAFGGAATGGMGMAPMGAGQGMMAQGGAATMPHGAPGGPYP
ncbi:hypothetical protein RHOSPDRAFT_32238 [Rhodotorula sp. JG-1b]|nr:hypothetical protein RHOSPDRAFT_32238 [Rhodotorula sp. JG-1b]